MNIDHLKYLIAISKEKTMSDAAEKLFVTPQALSMAIKKLEEELKMPLLSRSSTGTTLTENGRWLVQRSEEFFGDLEKRQQDYQAYLNSDNLIPVGEMELLVNAMGIGHAKLADMVCRVTLKHPDFKVRIIERTKQEIEQAVSEEAADYGFIYRTKLRGRYIDKLDDELAFYPLQPGELVIQASPQLQLTRLKNLSLKKTTGCRFCVYDIHEEGRVEEFLEAVTGERVECLSTNSFSVYKSSLESGKYIAASLRMSGDEQCINYLPSLKLMPLRDDIVVYFGVIRKKSHVIARNAAFIWNELLKEYGGIKNA